MPLSPPLSWIPQEHEKKVVISLLVLCFVGLVGLAVADQSLRSEVTPLGIVSLQFVGNAAEAQRVLSTWGEEGRVAAAFSLGVDYLFLTANALLLAFLAGLVGRKASGRSPLITTLSPWVAWAFILAGACDATENAAFFIVLVGDTGDFWPCLGTWFATVKFSLLGLGMIYLLGSGGFLIASKK